MTEAQEAMLGRAMLAFERDQWKKKRRPRLPCDAVEGDMSASKQAIKDQRGAVRESVFEYVRKNMQGREFDCEDVAREIEMNRFSVGNYLRQMEEKGEITALRRDYRENRIRYRL